MAQDFVACSENHDCGSHERPVIQLNRVKIPLIVVDALMLVKEIGERYLRVDALCIVQDDPAELKSTIRSMDRIYEDALLTIIPASGEDADSGLKGVRPTSREVSSITQEIDGIPLIFSKGFLEMERTPWSKRGWTFQEAIFSQKWLILADDRVFYGCSDGMLGEYRPDDPLAEGDLYKKSHGIDPCLDAKWDGVTFWQDYTSKVKQYTSRTLTYDTDVLDAFAGLTRRYEEQTGSAFSWGLPTNTNLLFSVSLLWKGKDYSKCWNREKPHWRRQSLRRRELWRRGRTKFRDITGTYFPSYLWAGRIGGNVEWEWPEETRTDISHITTPIRWGWERRSLVEAQEQTVYIGVLTFVSEFAVLSREDLKEPGLVIMDDGTIWRTGPRSFVLLAEIPETDSQESIVYLLIIKEEQDVA
jgi:hypothetical protein